MTRAEVELRLRIPPAAIPRLLRHPALVAVRAGRSRRAHLVATYFDTPDQHLAQAGIAVRVRHETEGWVQAVKGPPLPASSGALVAREEYETPLPGGDLDPEALAATPWSRTLADALADPGFGPQFVTDFERRMVPLRFADGRTALLAVDHGELRDLRGERRRDIAEVEIEQQDGAPLDLFALAAMLAADLPLRIQMASKAERGYALLSDGPDGWRQPVRARTPTFPPGCDAATALCAVVRECVGQIAANAAGLLQDDDPEWVHQMRVGTRRLRACLALLRPLLPPPVLGTLGAELRWLAAALGHARDRDVYVTELLRPLAAAAGPDTALARAVLALQEAADGERRDARAAVRAVVDSARFTRLVLALGALGALRRFGVPETADGVDPLGQPVAEFAGALLQRRHRQVRRRGATLASASDAERHALRIAAKKMRYAAEFFAPAFGHPKRSRAYGASLAALQDVLGRQNDAATAARLTAALTAGRADLAEASGGIGGWTAAHRVGVERELASAWRKFRRAPRFWRANPKET